MTNTIIAREVRSALKVPLNKIDDDRTKGFVQESKMTL
jgi:hypothetical protein